MQLNDTTRNRIMNALELARIKTEALDELGLAITNAGYKWTSEMRKAYEKGHNEHLSTPRTIGDL
jgi:hypothetical protein